MTNEPSVESWINVQLSNAKQLSINALGGLFVISEAFLRVFISTYFFIDSIGKSPQIILQQYYIMKMNVIASATSLFYGEWKMINVRHFIFNVIRRVVAIPKRILVIIVGVIYCFSVVSCWTTDFVEYVSSWLDHVLSMINDQETEVEDVSKKDGRQIETQASTDKNDNMIYDVSTNTDQNIEVDVSTQTTNADGIKANKGLIEESLVKLTKSRKTQEASENLADRKGGKLQSTPYKGVNASSPQAGTSQMSGHKTSVESNINNQSIQSSNSIAENRRLTSVAENESDSIMSESTYTVENEEVLNPNESSHNASKSSHNASKRISDASPSRRSFTSFMENLRSKTVNRSVH